MKLCEECHKEAAAVFLKLSVNNKVTEAHLCAACAAKKGVGLGADPGAFNISDIVGNLSDYYKEFLPSERKTLRCDSCGLTYARFKESGRLGCPDCYKSFEPQLTELMTRIHGSSQHAGRVYAGGKSTELSKAEEAKRIEKLKAAMQEAVRNEDFVTASRLRDALKKLESRNG